MIPKRMASSQRRSSMVAISCELLAILWQGRRIERFGVAALEARGIDQARRAMGVQAEAGVQVIALFELATIFLQRLFLGLDRAVDAHQAVRELRRPNLVAHALELQR